MKRFLARSVRRKFMAVVFAATVAALLSGATALFIFDLREYERSWNDDLLSQANILAGASTAALAFDDPEAARENLAALRLRPQIITAAIYAEDGTLFAEYPPGSSTSGLPPLPPETRSGSMFDNVRELSVPVVQDGETLGAIYLRARYGLVERLRDYLAILSVAVAIGMGVALLVSLWLQTTITEPILAVTQAARRVLERRDYSQRVKKTTSDEIGVLVDAFNDMMSEVGRRAEALEASNRSLQHEIAERLAAVAALRTADRRKDEFLATLAHELRNPLAPIGNALEILRLAPDKPELAEEARAMMGRQLRQMVRLVDDLLDVSRITTGKLTLSLATVDLASVVTAAVETVKPLIEAGGHKLEIALPEKPVHLHADATRLAQVFSNLLSNAAKYSRSNSRIRLEGSLREGAVVVKVIDEGIGIAPDILPEIFEMFVQADTSLERTSSGLGVGLSLAKRLVDLHDGTIEAHSAGLGHGSEFVVRLPRLPEVAADPISRRERGESTPGTRSRVLVADDNLDFADSFAMLFTMMGHEVRICHDGPSALQAAREFDPDFAFLDIGLPGMNGYELAERLRAAPETRHIVLTAVTGWGQEEDRQRARQAGFAHHMVKPAQLERVKQIMEIHAGAS